MYAPRTNTTRHPSLQPYIQLPTAGVDTQRRIHIQRQQQWRGPVYRERNAHISVLAPPRNRIPLSTGRLITLLLAAGGARRPDPTGSYVCCCCLHTEQAWDCSLSLSLSLLGHTTGSLILPRVSYFACHTRQCPAGGRIAGGVLRSRASASKRTVLRVICVRFGENLGASA